MRPHPETSALGAILAGGASRRFGAPKALAMVGGSAMVERVRIALVEAGLTPVLVGTRRELEMVDLPRREDGVEGCGPLSGVRAALLWARELGLRGAICVACDLPLLAAPLLRELRERGESSAARAVAPSGRGGQPEPLCAWYAVSALPEIERRMSAGELRMRDLVAALEAEQMPLNEVSRFGDPARLFLNVNTPAERDAAECLASSRSSDM
jgi:molybdopterin-guanine dinucleotide biosynthesis protein A